MNQWLWAMAGVLAIDVIGKMLWLGTGKIEPRTPKIVATDLAFNVLMLVWLAAVWK